MKAKVAIYQSQSKKYSDDWQYLDDYPEKEYLRSLAFLLGNSDGNLFKGIVEPGETVVIKPNWVIDKHEYGYDVFSIITHSSILRAIVDMVYDELRGEGRIIIADAPQGNCDFDNLLRVCNVQKIQEYYWNKFRFEVAILDLRQIFVVYREGHDFVKSSGRVQLPGDPMGYVGVNLGKDSAFVGMKQEERIYGADYDRKETKKHHNKDHHEYLISKTVLNTDLVIHVPKLKVHKKVGTTLNAKGMVGINGNKNWIAHFRVGSPSEGGDEYSDKENTAAKFEARMRRVLKDYTLAPKTQIGDMLYDLINETYKKRIKPFFSFFKKCVQPFIGQIITTSLTISAGNWYGNDTAWRMTADLARIILYADQNGCIQNRAQRKFFSIIDGIVGGEKDGPLAPTPKPSGVIIAGSNLLAVDLVGTRLMGFSWNKIKYLDWLINKSPQSMGITEPENDIEVISNVPEWSRLMVDDAIQGLDYVPHPGWTRHIEID